MTYRKSPFLRVHKPIENKSGAETTLYIYDEISWWGVSAEQFVKDLNAATSDVIHIRINSPGGSVFDGTSIYNAIKQHKAKTIIHIDGLAASIASIIALAGDEVWMGENAFFMIHEPWSVVVGNAQIMRDEADLLDKVSGTIVNIYVKKTGQTEDEIKSMMAKETWFTAKEALEAGFIDKITDDEKENKASASLFDLSIYANVPDKLKDRQAMPTERDLEKILRDAGFSRAQAKAIVAAGYPVEQRDVVQPEPMPEPKQRDVVEEPKPRSRVEELLVRAERMAKSTN